MKTLAKLNDLIGERLTLARASREMLALVFGDRFVILSAENPDPDFEPLRISESGDILDFGESALIESGIASAAEIDAIRSARDEAKRVEMDAWRKRRDGEEREQYERLRQKFGDA